MNATTALLCGLAATLLLALGLVRSAERFDPIMRGCSASSPEMSTARPGNLPCGPCIEPHSLCKDA